MDDIPEVVLVTSKKRRKINSSSGLDGLVPSGFVAGRPISWYGQAASSSSQGVSFEHSGMDLPGLRADAPSRRNASSRGRVPESLTLEVRKSGSRFTPRYHSSFNETLRRFTVKDHHKSYRFMGLTSLPTVSSNLEGSCCDPEAERLPQRAAVF